MEYRSTTGRPCGQLIGQSVLASASSSHSIFDWSSGVFTLIAAWHAVDAAIFACSVSIEIAAFSRSMPSRISVSSFSASGAPTPAGTAWIATLLGPMGSTSNPFANSSSAIFSNVTIWRGDSGAKGSPGSEWNPLFDGSEGRAGGIKSAVGADTDLFHGRNNRARHARFHRRGRYATGKRPISGAPGLRRGGSGRSETCNRPRARQCLANCIARKIVDQLRTPEAHFDFGRVHVDVDFGVGHLQEKQRRGKDARRQDVAIGLVNGVQNRP